MALTNKAIQVLLEFEVVKEAEDISALPVTTFMPRGAVLQPTQAVDAALDAVDIIVLILRIACIQDTQLVDSYNTNLADILDGPFTPEELERLRTALSEVSDHNCSEGMHVCM